MQTSRKLNIKKKHIYMKTKHILFFTFLFLFSCKFQFTDDELHLPRRDYYGTELKVNGCYYILYENTMTWVYFLFNNGTILYWGCEYSIDDTIEFNKDLMDKNYISYLQEDKVSWGIYIIENDSIKFERWYPREPPSPAYVRSGIILNDTTFLITEGYRLVRGEKTEYRIKDETYHFKKISPKPDSTNRFVP